MWYTTHEIPWNAYGPWKHLQGLVYYEILLERMERKLTRWKKFYLRPEGLMLCKSTLCSLSIDNLTSFTIPINVANRIKKLQRNFIWGGMIEAFKFHLVYWNMVWTFWLMGSYNPLA